MKCPKCNNKMTQLLVNWVCDVCDPPSGHVIIEPTQNISSYDRNTVFNRVMGFIDTRIQHGHPFLIAGGAGLFAEGYTNNYGDVDVFVPLSNNITDNVIDKLVNPKGNFKAIGQTKKQALKLKHFKSSKHNIAAIFEYQYIDTKWDKKIQLIFMNVDNINDPLKILQGFDWNFCQVGIDENETKISTTEFYRFTQHRKAFLTPSLPTKKTREPKVWTRLLKHAIRQSIIIPPETEQFFPSKIFELSAYQQKELWKVAKFKMSKYTKNSVVKRALSHFWDEMGPLIKRSVLKTAPIQVIPSQHSNITFIHNIISYWSNKFTNYFT